MSDKDRNDKGQFVKGNSHIFLKGHPKSGGRKKVPPEELLARFQEYLKKCKKNKKGMTIQGVTKVMGMSKSTFYEYYRKDPLYADLVDYILAEIEEWWTQYGLTGKATAYVIFYLKNFFGWKDDRSLRLGGMSADEAEPIRIVTSLVDLKGAVSGRPDIDEETE